MTHQFKIRSVKFLAEKKDSYLFCESKTKARYRFSIPKTQTLKFERVVIKNLYTKIDEDWIDISVTDWIWNKSNLEKKLKSYKMTSDVVISGETHFGICWDFVMMKRKNKFSCFFCQEKITGKSYTDDHLIPRSILRAYGLKGGIPNNTVPCCKECNSEKANLHPEVYRELVKRKIHNGEDVRYRVILFTLNQVLKIS